MIMDKRALGIRDCAFDRVKLLCEIDALTATFNHRDNGRQMTIRPFQTFDYSGMGLVLHDVANIPWGRIIANKFTLKFVSAIGSFAANRADAFEGGIPLKKSDAGSFVGRFARRARSRYRSGRKVGARLPASGSGSSKTAKTALRFRFVPPTSKLGAGGSLTLTISTDHSMGADHLGADHEILATDGQGRAGP